MIIAVDFTSIPNRPRNSRPVLHLLHFALLSKRFGHKLKAVVDDWVVESFPILKLVQSDWVNDRASDIYIARSDIFFYDDRWHSLEDFNSFKVCLNTLDFLYQETACMIEKRVGSPVQARCDLYLPVNYSQKLMEQHGYKTVPVAHTIDHRMVELFMDRGLYEDYLLDNIKKIRKYFAHNSVVRPLGFMGNIHPNRAVVQRILPKWVDFRWQNNAPSKEYIKFLCGRHGSLDIRGYGDKNIRFVESVMFGRTVITVSTTSQYVPPLIDGKNCVLGSSWEDLADLQYEPRLWDEIAEQATMDYLDHWSPLAQFRMILDRHAQH